MAVEETKISETIQTAMADIERNPGAIPEVHVTLVVKKNGLSDLSIINLPEITAHPSKRISDMMMGYFKADETIIVNVLSASSNFDACNSSSISQQANNGKRTLTVITNCDKAHEGLVEKITRGGGNLGFGYICLQDPSNKQTNVFETHLSEIEKSRVGIDNLVNKLVEIQSRLLVRCLPVIVNNLKDKLLASTKEEEKLPKTPDKSGEAMLTYMHMCSSLKEALRGVLMEGKVGDYIHDKEAHYEAWMEETLTKLSTQLQSTVAFAQKDFLVAEINAIDKARGLSFPRPFLPRSLLLASLEQKVKGVRPMLFAFVDQTTAHIELISAKLVADLCRSCLDQLLPHMKKATENLFKNLRRMFLERVDEIIQMESITYYTCDPHHQTTYKTLVGSRDEVFKSSYYHFEVYGSVNTNHLVDVHSDIVYQAFHLKMSLAAYWKTVLNRMKDFVVLQLRFLVHQAINKDLEAKIVEEVVSHGGIDTVMMTEPPSVGRRKEQIKRRMTLLKKSLDIAEMVKW